MEKTYKILHSIGSETKGTDQLHRKIARHKIEENATPHLIHGEHEYYNRLPLWWVTAPEPAAVMAPPTSTSPLSRLFISLPKPSAKPSRSAGPDTSDGARNQAAALVLRRREAAAAVLSAAILSRVFPASAAEVAAGECTLEEAPSGLAFCDRVVGTGAAAQKGQLIRAHYRGMLEDGTVFDSSYSRGKPLTIMVGVGEVIKGWDLGIAGGEGIPPMLVGGKRTLRLPPSLAYGEKGAGCRGWEPTSCVIPPNSTLLFDVEYVGRAIS